MSFSVICCINIKEIKKNYNKFIVKRPLMRIVFMLCNKERSLSLRTPFEVNLQCKYFNEP